MTILALDTTREFGSIALTRGGKLVDEILIHAPGGFGPVLLENIHRMLERQSVALSEIDLFAAASGPGSFTGVRIGLACIKGLAEATGKPAAAVSNLAALAESGSTQRRAAIIDARRGQVYAALFDSRGGAIIEECVIRFPDFLALLPEGEVEFIATDFSPFREFVGAAAITEAPRAQAPAIAKIAARTPGRDPAELDANYVRRSDAELLWRESR